MCKHFWDFLNSAIVLPAIIACFNLVSRFLSGFSRANGGAYKNEDQKYDRVANQTRASKIQQYEKYTVASENIQNHHALKKKKQHCWAIT